MWCVHAYLCFRAGLTDKDPCWVGAWWLCVCVWCVHAYLCFRAGLTDKDPRWVGAWWLAFLIGGGLLALFATPMSGFPRDLPGASAMGSLEVQTQHAVYTT